MSKYILNVEINDDKFELGCGIPEECDLGNPKCSLCHNADDCNKDPPRKCYYCDNEESCNSKDKMTKKICERYNKECMVDESSNYRDCELYPSREDYKFCEHDLCNGGKIDISCLDSNLEETKCPKDIDQCYTFIQGDQIHRGCLSDSEHKDECGGTTESDTCLACDESDLCNYNRVCASCSTAGKRCPEYDTIICEKDEKCFAKLTEGK